MDQFLSNPELIYMYRYGFDLYEDTIIPATDFSTVTFVDSDMEAFSYSNCAESTLFNFIAALMFNPKTHALEVDKVVRLGNLGCSLNPGFVEFVNENLTSVAAVNGFTTHNTFAQLVSNANTPETSDEVRYRKIKGVNQEDKNGIYELNKGLDNFLRAFGYLLGASEWKDMKGSKSEIWTAISHNLYLICKLFSSEGHVLTWKFEDEDDKELDEVAIEFFLNGSRWYFLNFEDITFRFMPMHDRTIFGFQEIARQILQAEKPWHSSFALLIPDTELILGHTFSSNQKCAEYLRGYLFAADLESLNGRAKALAAILKYKEITSSAEFDYIIDRWLTSESEYFGRWQDSKLRWDVLNILASNLSFEEIMELNVPELSHYFAADQRKSTFVKACVSGEADLAELILEQEGMFDALAEGELEYIPEQSHDFDDDDSSDDETEQTFSFLHALARLNLPGYMQQAIDLGVNVDALDSSGQTPLMVAHEKGHQESIEQLLMLGALGELQLDEPFSVSDQTDPKEE